VVSWLYNGSCAWAEQQLWAGPEDKAFSSAALRLGSGFGGVKLRLGDQSRFHRWVIILMIAAMLEFALQTAYIQPSAEAAGTKAGSPHGYAAGPLPYRGHPKTHIVTHVHADGTVHRHAVGSGDGAVDDHLRESGSPCWSLAIVVGVVPSSSVCAIEAILIGKLAVEGLDPYRGTEPDGPRRPPRPPSIT
jgi:hypothetical protein